MLSYYRKAINPPYSHKDIPSLMATIALLLVLPFTVFLALQQQSFQQRAAGAPEVQFVDSTNATITQTSSPTVSVRLTAPWPVQPLTMIDDQSMTQAVAGASTAVFQVTSGADDVNQDGSSFTPTGNTIWLGNGQSTTASYTGLRFTNVTIPKGATITSAKLQVTPPQQAWIGMKFTMAADNSGNSAAFSTSSKPSQRALTLAKINHSSDANWAANTNYTLNEMKTVIQEVVNRSDWNSGNAMSVILKGTGPQWARKNIKSGTPTVSAKLIVTYDAGGALPTSVPPGTGSLPTTVPPTSIPPTIVPPTATTVPPTTVPPTATGPTPPSATAAVNFSVGAGFNDNVPRQLIRTASDRVYLFGGVVGTGNIKVYWNPAGGYPTASSNFSGSATATNPSNIFVVDGTYDGGNIIHIFVADMSGTLRDYPFNTSTNTFKPAKTVSTGNPTPGSPTDIGTTGVSSMFDKTNTLHLAYWASGNQIMYRSYTYDIVADSLTLTSGPTRLDSSGNANHPEIAVSPLDNSVTVAWVNGTSGAGTISARTKPSSGAWGSIEAASSGAVWTSPNSGINIDQGPSMVVASNGTKAFIYIENFGSCGTDYGRAHFVSKASGASTWTDQTLTNFCTHAPGLAIDNSNNFYILGHGHPSNPSCRQMNQICSVQRTSTGTWNNPVVYANPPAGDSFDNSISTKWSAVGWTRPETIEFAFFDAIGGSYQNTALWYGRLATTGSTSQTQTPTSVAIPTATPQPYTATVTISEDPTFLQNAITQPYTVTPLIMPYTFTNTTPGTKTLFVKFHATTGEERLFSNTIDLVAPTQPTTAPASGTAPTGMPQSTNGESMSMNNWQPGGKNAPNPLYDKCDDGTDVSTAHKAYYVIAYDGIKYPTWHPAVVTNPITGNGKCYFGHEHGSDPQKYIHWDEIYQHFGKDQNGDGTVTPMVINPTTGAITPGDRAGIPFGIANEHMDLYYNQGGIDSIFVRHEDHVGHKIEFVNKETDINTTIDGNITASTNEMAQIPGTNGLNVPYYTTGTTGYKPTGVVCTHLHKFHQGTHSGDAIRNNLHEVIFHSTCTSVDVNGINAPAYYPTNTVLLTGMMAFGKPGEYLRFCFADRTTKVCPDGKNADGSCVINDPLLSKMPNAINSTSLGRNMVDKYCLNNWTTLNPGNNYFGPYELWEGDLAIFKGDALTDSSMIAEHGRQWDVLDPIRFADVGYQHPTRSWQKDYQFNSENCKKPGGAFDALTFVGGCASRDANVAWDSPQSGFRGLKRTTYFGRNRVSNNGGSQIWWTNPLGGNAVTTEFSSGLKQRISTVEADIQKVQYRVQQLFGANNFLNDRAIQRAFNSGGNTVHAPN